MTPQFWKTREQVKRAWIANPNAPRKIGGWGTGEVFIGRIEFNDGSIHRVAIKVFGSTISDREASRIEKVIRNFKRAGVNIPKMGMVKMATERAPQGEWVQVSQLFGATTKGSKLAFKSALNIKSLKGRKEAVIQFTKIVNAGYVPFQDILEPWREPKKRVTAIDLDKPAQLPFPRPRNLQDRRRYVEIQRKIRSTEYLAEELVERIKQLAKSEREKKYLVRTAIEFANPEIAKKLQEYSIELLQKRRV